MKQRDSDTPTGSSSQQQQKHYQQQQQEQQHRFFNDIIGECESLRGSVQGINDRVLGPLGKNTQKSTKLPFVLLLGNHSSGKSSFANYLVGRQVQQTGVAPTDDGFTIICNSSGGDKETDTDEGEGEGEETGKETAYDLDRSGPAVVHDPELGFTGLSAFGPTLVHLTRLKMRGGLRNRHFMVVDTPGMIDSPASSNSNNSGSGSGSGSGCNVGYSRGYDFPAVCRWYAERADVILLFFDPDKPGTTGETLHILLHALHGLDYKLRILLNKADQFEKIHDFARCYGSLCWNLSKVISRKDLPQIHTMCTFDHTALAAAQASGSGSAAASPDSGSVLGSSSPAPCAAPQSQQQSQTIRDAIGDLLSARDEIVADVFSAPVKRVDNEIQRVSEAVAALTMHCRVLRRVQGRYREHWWRQKLALLAVGVATWGAATLVLGYLNSNHWGHSGDRNSVDKDASMELGVVTATPVPSAPPMPEAVARAVNALPTATAATVKLDPPSAPVAAPVTAPTAIAAPQPVHEVTKTSHSFTLTMPKFNINGLTVAFGGLFSCAVSGVVGWAQHNLSIKPFARHATGFLGMQRAFEEVYGIRLSPGRNLGATPGVGAGPNHSQSTREDETATSLWRNVVLPHMLEVVTGDTLLNYSGGGMGMDGNGTGAGGNMGSYATHSAGAAGGGGSSSSSARSGGNPSVLLTLLSRWVSCIWDPVPAMVSDDAVNALQAMQDGNLTRLRKRAARCLLQAQVEVQGQGQGRAASGRSHQPTVDVAAAVASARVVPVSAKPIVEARSHGYEPRDSGVHFAAATVVSGAADSSEGSVLSADGAADDEEGVGDANQLAANVEGGGDGDDGESESAQCAGI